MKFKTCIFAMALLSGSSFAQANDDKNTEVSAYSSKWEWGGHIGSLAINEESAFREGVEETAVVFGMSAHYDTQWLISSVNFDFISYDDRFGFSQQTEDSFGDIENSSSDASALMLSAATGPKYQFGPSNDALIYAQAGLAGIFASDRSIANCSNCFSDDIELEGGFFVKAGFKHNIKNAVALGFDLTQFVGSDDLDQSLNLTITSAF